MCTAANAQAIADIIQEYVDEEKNFTAFDITQQGLKRGTTTEVHSHLKSAVHTQWSWLQTQGYDRTLISAPGGRQAHLYHPIGADILPDIQRLADADTDNDGDDDNDNTLPSPNTSPAATTVADPTAASAVAAAVATATATGSADPAGQTRDVTDAEGRLNVGRTELQQLQCYPGRKIHVFENDNGQAELQPHTANSDGDLAVSSYTVNSDGRLRIGKRTLDAIFGSDNKGAFNIIVYSDKIIISEIQG